MSKESALLLVAYEGCLLIHWLLVAYEGCLLIHWLL